MLLVGQDLHRTTHADAAVHSLHSSIIPQVAALLGPWALRRLLFLPRFVAVTQQGLCLPPLLSQQLHLCSSLRPQLARLGGVTSAPAPHSQRLERKITSNTSLKAWKVQKSFFSPFFEFFLGGGGGMKGGGKREQKDR